MGTHFDPLYHAIVDGLDRATVRPVYNHGSATKLREDQSSLRLVCIGDAQRNIGLGGGGNLALQDAVDLSEALCVPGLVKAFVDDKTRGKNNQEITSPSKAAMDLTAALRGAEATMLKRKVDFHANRAAASAMLQDRPSDDKDPFVRSVGDFFPVAPPGAPLWRRASASLTAMAADMAANVSVAAYRWERAQGQVGSSRVSPTSPDVLKWLRRA